MLKKKIFIIGLVLMTMLVLVGSVGAVEWKAVNYASPEAIAESGLTVDEFNNLTKEEWNSLFAEKEKVNFAFSLQDGEGKDITNSSNPNVSINLSGLSDSQIVQFTDVELDSNVDQALIGEVYTFTNAGQTGRYGPSQTQLDNAYQGTNLEGEVISDNGIQEWTVPADGKYRITAYGAQGGETYGGKGAIVEGKLTINKNTKLQIIVGQSGEQSYSSSYAASTGGGGAFIISNSENPLIIAGGGGGRYENLSYTEETSLGSTNNNGKNGYYDNYLGGRYGLSAENNSSVYTYAFGGKGFYLTNVTDGNNILDSPNGTYWAWEKGGFGGGGGATPTGGTNLKSRGGGGGGYSGGGVDISINSDKFAAGGGGSYIDSTATNIATSDGKYNNSTTFNSEPIENLNSYNSGHGKVTIEYLGE